VLTRLGRYDEARSQAVLAQQLEPNFWLSTIASGRVLAAEGKLDEAIGVYQSAAERFDVPQIKADLALAYHAAHQHDELAKSLAAESLKTDPNLTSALTVLAEQALESREPAVAFEYTQRLIDQDALSVTGWLLHGDAALALHREALAKDAYLRAVKRFAETQQLGAPPMRLLEVQTALEQGKLPSVRYALADAVPDDRARPTAATPGAAVPHLDRAYPAPKPARSKCDCASGDLMCRMHCGPRGDPTGTSSPLPRLGF